MDKVKNIDEYLSDVRHDLRGQLAVIREYTSLVIDGLGNKDCDKCCDMLRPAWKATGKINKLIEELLTTPAVTSVFTNSGVSGVETIKTEFIATVSHELRTPLTTMKEFVAILLDEIPGKINKEQKEYLSIVKSNIDRLARIIENLLDISQIEAQKMRLTMTWVNIVDLAENALNILKSKADAKHIELRTSFPAVIPEVYVDAEKIIQVFTNLMENAVKFTPENGKITFAIVDKGKAVECSVADTGTGIAPENIGRVFDRFQQFNRTPGPGAQGTGLGLAITKEFIKMHGGRIWVESGPGKEGSKFTLTIPKGETLGRKVMVKKRILIVDDEPELVKAMQIRLKVAGYEVITAGDGPEGLEKAKKERPDIVLLDLLMPKMDGFQTLERLKQDRETKSIPVIMLTAKSQMTDVHKTADLGAEDYIVKPFDYMAMLGKIKKALQRS